MTNRRAFLGAIAGGLLAAPSIAVAQPTRMWRIGHLLPVRQADVAMLQAPFIEALRELGYVEGRNLQLETRTAEGDFSRLPALAAELAQSRVDVIVAASGAAIRAASQATKSTPIVMAFWGGNDLLESGIVASFARPGGNVTGIFMLADDLEGKRLEWLLQARPNARRIAMLNTGPRSGEPIPPEVHKVASAAKVEIVLTQVPGRNDYLSVFQAMTRDRIDAALVPSFPRFFLEQAQIFDAAANQRIPAIYEWGDMSRAGGLIAYGPVLIDLHRRAARYVDQILKGARPGELPVEQPTKFELVINLKTATALGMTIPQPLVLRADEVIR